jgi:cobalamin biosynthesis protein CobT
MTSRNVRIHSDHRNHNHRSPDNIEDNLSDNTGDNLPEQEDNQEENNPHRDNQSDTPNNHQEHTTQEEEEPNQNNDNQPHTRPQRQRRPPQYLSEHYRLSTCIDYAYTLISTIPTTYEEAINSPEATHLEAAMDK